VLCIFRQGWLDFYYATEFIPFQMSRAYRLLYDKRWGLAQLFIRWFFPWECRSYVLH